MRCLMCHRDGIPLNVKVCPGCGFYLPVLFKELLSFGHKLHSGTYEQSSPLAQGGFGETYSSLKTSTRLTNYLGMEFVMIEPGSFKMGSLYEEDDDDEGEHENKHEYEINETPHWVKLTTGYYLQTTPVTQGQWEAVMGNNPSSFKGSNLPVETVSWEDCQEFIKKLNDKNNGVYRLPTEAEWENACRAGTCTPFGIGNGFDIDSSLANFDGQYPYGAGKEGTYLEKSTPVASYPPNAWGLYDMHGNVWEWCQDWYGDYPSKEMTNPVGPQSGSKRVARGGCWFNSGPRCRSASRLYHDPSFRFYILGLRLLRLAE